MSNGNGGWVIVVIVALLLFQGGGGAAPGPDPVVAVPNAETQAAFADLKTLMATKPGASSFGADWRDLHSVVTTSGVKITTNQQLCDLIDRFSKVLVTQRHAGSPFTGFTDATQKGITKLFTDENSAIDPAKAADAILGIAWACGG